MSALLSPPLPEVVAFETMTCGQCGVHFAMDARFFQKRREDHGTWYCPNGHARHFTGKTEADRLRQQLERAEASARFYRERRDDLARDLGKTERRLSATRGVVTRHKRRIQAGRCVCCSRQFKDLKRHMATQHPDWSPERQASALEGRT